MIRIKNIEVMNFDGALRGMRNPMNSWNQGDSGYGCNPSQSRGLCRNCSDICEQRGKDYLIGPNDLMLAQKLIKAGTDHSKFMRQILVSFDVTAPLYW